MDFLTQEWGPEGANCVISGVPTLACIWVVLQNLINAATFLSGVVAVLLIIYAGYQYLTSEGDPAKVESARKTITFTIIGIVIVIFAFAIVRGIGYVTGLEPGQLTTPPTAE